MHRWNWSYALPMVNVRRLRPISVVWKGQAWAQVKAGGIGGIDCVMPDAKRETGDALKAGSRTIFGFSRLPSSAASVFCLKPQALLSASVPAGWLPSLPTLKFHPPGGREWHALQIG